jgi:hypothetical protein
MTMLTDTDLIHDAMAMIADPTMNGTWPEVVERLNLDDDEDATGEAFCTAQYALWLCARMAQTILTGDRDGLLALMDTHDPGRKIRNRSAGAAP